MNRLSRPALLLIGLGIAGLAQADSFRCGGKLVNSGDRLYDVQRKCGAPADRSITGYTLDAYGRQEAPVEEWVYPGGGGAYSVLTFVAGRLDKVELRRP
ncbi:DUF2845 domain-containing protein [Pseudomonas mangiferae]|uniref:DUF2845 domain-containing protein n=1 Tax=Pseudomonas mangiferae TaxID=2593654 RepID=A0A553H2Q3_9PSED|nr:DUF2845 domain-containing protein [Pseudomonas mangiferae]TRX76006.1 DUF2845 domain-containing protein [Pseudomonas mangiferae]